MNFEFDNKSLLIGIAAGFSVAILVLSICMLVMKNQELAANNQKLKQSLEYQQIINTPIKKVAENKFEGNTEYVYEETTKLATADNHENVTAEKTDAKQEEKQVVNNEYFKAEEEPSAQKALEVEKKEIPADAPLYIKNQKTVALDPTKKKIAIVIDDLGVHVENSDYSAKMLPKEVTFSYLPYGKSTQRLIKQEFDNGREAMLHLPTEPVSSIDPGPNALYANMSKEKIESLTYYNLNQVIDYVVGANNHMGSKFTANLKDMEYVVKIMGDNGLFFMDSFTTAKTQVRNAKNNIAKDMPLLKRNIFLDHKRTKEFITTQLEKVEKVADARGYAIAIGHPHKITTDVLVEWAKTLDKKGYQLVPITAILDIPGARL